MDQLEVLLLDEQEVAGLLSLEEVLEVVELAFRERGLGYVQMPAKTYLQYSKDNGDLRTMPAYLERLDISAVKVVNAHPENMKKFGLPTVMATILLVEPKNGKLLAVMGGTRITSMRTGAAGGIATKYLARKDSKAVGFIGAGVQARTQLLALATVLQDLTQIRVWDLFQPAAEAFAADIKSKSKEIQVEVAKTAKDAIKDVDIVVTTTPSTRPIVQNSWVADGTHFNCIGADAPGKEEMDPAILRRSRIIVDDWEQASHSGEINVPISNGLITKESIWAELSEVVAGRKPGRSSQSEVTVFDSTGLAIQDAVTAELVYRKAVNKNIGRFINI